jgi:GntR family transcriptional regulator / MocR family aminotransferase
MLLLPPDRSLKKPLQAQLFEQLQELIHSGRLAPLTRMPATRELAEELCVSRTTVLLVYDELIAEGYLQTEPAVGTFVSPHPPCAAARLGIAAAGRDRRLFETPPRNGDASAAPSFDFRSDSSDERLFPHKAWRSLLSRLLKEGERDQECDHPAGLERLRGAVARWITAERGSPAAAEQIVIVSGRPQAQQILARLLLGRGKIALVDIPFPPGVAATFAGLGARVLPLPADDVGLFLRSLEAGAQRVALIWLALPGRVAVETRLALWKRRELVLEWAHRTGVALVEYEGADHGTSPLPTASGKVPARMIRLAAFSPTLSRGARLGYMVMPSDLVEPATALRASFEDGRSWLEQMALARFIEEGGYARHLRRVDKIYLARRAALIGALRRHFDEPRLEEAPAADHIRWRLPPAFPTAAAVQRHAWSHGVRLDAADDDTAAPGSDAGGTLCLGYARMDEEQIAAGMARLAAAMSELQAGDLRIGRREATEARWDKRDFA